MTTFLLNEAQKKAVYHTEGPLLVLAGAGSGKTRVITQRIAHLLRKGVDSRSILALSFTNKAAREVLERVKDLSGSRADGVTVSTFHSLGLAILKEEGKRIGFPRGFTLMNEGERRAALRQLAKETAPNVDPQLVGEAISRWKNRGLTAKDVKESNEPALKALINSYSVYEAFLKAQSTVDFDDLLLLPLLILKESHDCRHKWSERFHYIMVDEYQDTNRVQFLLLLLLAGERKNLAVVGDDDQSIYGWRGAEVELILNFPQHFPGAATVTLEENYRSTSTILEAAHAVVSKLVYRHPKKLKLAEESDRGRGDPLMLMEADCEDSEAEEIASAILAERYRTRRPWSHFAVLYRVNSQSKAFEQAFRAQEIPHTVIGGNRFFDYKEVRDVLSYLKVIQNPRDDASLMRIANVPKRGLGHQSMIRLMEEAKERKAPLYSVLETAEHLSSQARAGAKTLVEILFSFRRRFSGEGLSADGLEEMITRLGLKDEVHANYDSAKAVKRRLELLHELPQTVETLAKGRKAVPLDEFIEKLTLDPPADKEEDEEDSVKLMTLHSAKGLEFPIVFLSGMEDGLMPLRSSEGSGDVREEEERRLCYVGMTRAKSRLILSRARTRKRNGTIKTSLPSPYLLEVPTGLTDKGGATPTRTVEEETEMAANFFKSLKEKLQS